MKATRFTFLLFAVSVSLPVSVYPHMPRLVQLCAILAVATFVAEVIGNRKLRLPSRVRRRPEFRITMLGALLMLIAGASSAISATDSLAALEVGLRYGLGAALMVALVSSHRNPKSLQTLATALVVGACTAAALAIAGYQIPELGATTIGVSRRAKVFFEHPNQLGMVLSAVIVIPTARLVTNPLSLLNWLAAVLIAVGVVISGSMANVLLLVAGPLLVILAMLRNTSTVQRTVLSTVGVVLVVAALLFGGDTVASVSPRLSGMLEGLTTRQGDLATVLPSVAERLGLYGDAWSMFRESPLLGIGGDNAHQYLRTPSGRPIPHAHNYFLDVLMSMGVLGGAAVAVFAFGWLLTALNSLRTGGRSNASLTVGIGAALVIFLLSNQSSDSLGGTIIYLLWLLLGIALTNLQAPQPRHRESLVT